MLDPTNAIDTTNLRASLYRLGTKLFIDRALLDAARRLARRTGACRHLDAAGIADRRQRCIGAGPEARPRVGALIEAVDRWWIASDFSADRDACLAELKRLVDAQA